MKKSNKVDSNPTMQRAETAPAKPIATPKSWPHGPNEPKAGLRVLVTGAMAREWLKTNTSNRPIKRTRVEEFKAILRGGRWIYDGTPAQFGYDDSGNVLLFNAQHRLTAIAETDIAAEMAIVTGLPRAARRVIDTGIRCNASQAWMRETGTALSNWNIARVNAAWQGLNNGNSLRTAETWGAAYEMFRDGLVAMEGIFKSHKARTNNAPYIAAFIVAHYENPQAVERMARIFEDGAGFESGTPVHVLNKYVGGPAEKDDSYKKFNRTLNLIAAHIDGKTRNIPRTDESVTARFRKAVGLPPVSA